jgi:hypothetical protein
VSSSRDESSSANTLTLTLQSSFRAPPLESANRPAQMASRDSVGGLVSQAPVKARLSWVREVKSSLVKTLPR